MDWQPIETAPRDGTKVLLWVHDDYVLGYFETAKEWKNSETGFNAWTTGPVTQGGYDCGFERIGQPTHWAALRPPK
jgi:hypothetical protein